jgi:hypothetical protein
MIQRATRGDYKFKKQAKYSIWASTPISGGFAGGITAKGSALSSWETGVGFIRLS